MPRSGDPRGPPATYFYPSTSQRRKPPDFQRASRRTTGGQPRRISPQTPTHHAHTTPTPRRPTVRVPPTESLVILSRLSPHLPSRLCTAVVAMCCPRPLGDCSRACASRIADRGRQTSAEVPITSDGYQGPRSRHRGAAEPGIRLAGWSTGRTIGNFGANAEL